MTDRWTRLQEIVGQATELTAQERDAFLLEAAAGDEGLRAEAAELLDASLADDDFLEPLVGDGAFTPGSVVGPFRIVRTLGRGGMGMVFEAEQDSPSRRVALKVMRDDLVTAASRERFRFEVEALGALTHPGIARIYQAGLEGNVPWFAMEYVEDARPLTAYCGQRALDHERRIALVAEVAAAIHHGHVKGVLHRDLKPDNLLVGGDGRVRVIDFGMARLTDAERRLATIETESRRIVGTLAYMSPEQVRGEPGDARSDVYGLGVVLYELLTDRLPVAVDPGDFLTSARRIVEDPPRRPAMLDPRCKGDVEAVLLSALEKDPERRYASAAAFAEDLGRLRRREPVSARVPGAWARLRAFARRNRALVGAAAVVVVVSLAAAAVSIAFALRSNEAEIAASQMAAEAADERDRADDLLGQSLQRGIDTTFRAVPRIHALPGGAAAAEEVMRRTVADLEALHEQAPDAPRIRLALAEAHIKLGDVLGNPQYANIGNPTAAAEAYARAKAVVAEPPGFGARTRHATVLRAVLLRKEVELRGRRPDAEGVVDRLERAVELLDPIVAAHPADVVARSERALALRNLAYEHMRRGDEDRALPSARRAVAELETLHVDEPEDPRHIEGLSAAQFVLGRLHVANEQLDEAAAAYDRAIELLEPIVEGPVRAMESGLYLRWLGRASLALRKEDHDRADALVGKAKDAAIGACEADPGNHRRRFAVCAALIDWVRVAEQAHGADPDGKPPAAARARARKAADVIERLAPDPNSTMRTMFGAQLRAYADGKQPAGSLMGALGR